MQVLDIVTGTGLAAEGALALVGPAGHVTAADLWAAMVEKARQRLSGAPNFSAAVEDGQALSFPDEHFDAVIYSLGLMFFPDPLRGLQEFRRVLRAGGRAAVPVNTVAERSYNNFINLAIARHQPSLKESASRIFSIGGQDRLCSLFDAAGFADVQVATVSNRFVLPSFAAYFEPFEKGGGPPGQAFTGLPKPAQDAVRKEVQQLLGDTGGPVALDAEYRLASGRR